MNSVSPAVTSSLTGVALSDPTSVVSSAEKTIGTVASTRPSPTFSPSRKRTDVAALSEPTAVVRELDADLVLAGGDRRFAVDLELLEPEEVVAVRRLALVGVERPTAERATLRDDHALGAALRHLDLGRDRVRLVLERDDGVLRQPAHSAEEQLSIALDQLRPSGEVGVEPLEPAVVERQHVVLRRPRSGTAAAARASFSGCSAARSCACVQSSGP